MAVPKSKYIKSKYIKSKYIKSKYIKSKYISWYMQFNPQRRYPYNIILSYRTLKILSTFKHKFRMKSLYRYKRVYCLNRDFIVLTKNFYYNSPRFNHKQNILRYMYKL